LPPTGSRGTPAGLGADPGLLIAPLTVSYLIVGLGLLIVLTRAGLGLSLWTAAIGHVVINLPLAFAIIYASMGAQQQNAERAARDLGADEARVVLLVTVPMLAPLDRGGVLPVDDLQLGRIHHRLPPYPL
jgi:ABC-type spermidine/putrescine transport system permease subunit II